MRLNGEATLLALVGATATGKTELGERLAARLGAEIVCADSRQVFAELDIGTGKPDASARRARPHHLFDALPLETAPSAGWYARTAARVIEEIRSRGRRVLLVGGAGLYLRALREGLAPEPEIDGGRRAELRARHRDMDMAELRARLERLDPEAAARLRPADRQRTSRALEVVEGSGRPLGWWQRQPVTPPVAGPWNVVELRVETGELDRRIGQRTTWMFEHGLIEETRALRERGRGTLLRRLRAVGYDEALDLLEGSIDRAEAEARTHRRTRQLAKRQRTWFRHQLSAGVLAAEGDVETLLAAALDLFGAQAG